MPESAPEPADDEQEIEVSGFKPAGALRWSRPLPGPGTSRRQTRRARLRTAALVVLVSLLLVGLGVPDLRALVTGRVAEALGIGQTTTRAIPVVPRATPQPVAPAIPLVPAPPLAAAPHNCPAPPQPLTAAQVPFFGRAIGSAPVFVVGLSGSHPTLHLGGVTGQTYTPYGWPALLTWALAPGYENTATLHVTNLADGASVPITAGFSSPPAASVILDPNDPNAPPQLSHWSLWSGTIYPPGAGCYVLEASSLGGSWTLPFAAGR